MMIKTLLALAIIFLPVIGFVYLQRKIKPKPYKNQGMNGKVYKD